MSKQISKARISNYIPQFTVGYNYLCMPSIPASGNNVLKMSVVSILEKIEGTYQESSGLWSEH